MCVPIFRTHQTPQVKLGPIIKFHRLSKNYKRNKPTSFIRVPSVKKLLSRNERISIIPNRVENITVINGDPTFSSFFFLSSRFPVLIIVT